MEQALHEEILQRLERIERISTIAAKSVLNVEEAATMTGYTVKYLYRLVHERAIPHSKSGNRLYFDKLELERWLLRDRRETKEERKEATAKRPEERPMRLRPAAHAIIR